MARTPKAEKPARPARAAKPPKAAKPAAPKAAPKGAKAKPGKADVAPPERMRVTNWERWGDLVKAWTTGKPHRATKKTYSVPRTLDELKKQCKDAGVGLNIPDFVTDLVVYTHEKSTMVLRLPPADLVAESEKKLKAGAAYLLPSFYADALGVSGQVPHFRNNEELMDFHASRIGDYTLSMCQ